MTTIATRAFRTFRFRFNPLAYILRLDAAYREMRKFKELDEERLADMGLTKKDKDRAFLQQFAARDR
jgi:uncharacterized protein YjiS (DUF1127 family)